MEEQVNQLAEQIIKSSKIVVFTGAGASTESGIPDFRSPGGVWDRYDPDVISFQNFLTVLSYTVKVAKDEEKIKNW